MDAESRSRRFRRSDRPAVHLGVGWILDLTTDDPHEVTDAMIRSFVEIRAAAGLSRELTQIASVLPLAGAGD